MDERTRRIGLNEAVFREVNEQLAGMAADRHLSLVCECGSAACTERISMSRSDYERLRQDGATFAVIPGHEIDDAEEVVGRHAEFWVVRKRSGGPAALAESLDPRG
ncbi:MAG TPA: hypothetical protein VJ689_11695 [Gaiellaceae bacterium]|nr:hypothetical protein [Gaiellaceae bacterium]